MKKFFVCLLIACLLLTSGCCCMMEPDVTPEPRPVVTAPTQASVQEVTQAPTEATEPEIEVPETVTVYLVDQIAMVDNGYLEFQYDAEYNMLQADHWGIEGDHWYTIYFEDRDSNGMPGTIRTVWDSGYVSTTYLTYDANGNLESEEDADSQYTGYQYAYDQQGNMVEKRLYYEGILEDIIYCRYAGGQLAEAYGETADGYRNMEARIENGRIVETQHLGAEDAYSYLYTYDENGNVYQSFFSLNYEEASLQESYSYIAVEVDCDRVQYILQQQAYILSVL